MRPFPGKRIAIPLAAWLCLLAATAHAQVSTNSFFNFETAPVHPVARGWYYDATNNTFLSDRTGETWKPAALQALVAPGNELTYMLVPIGSGRRIGIDRDLDGVLDGDLIVQSVNVGTNGPAINCTSVIGLNYQLQFKTNLADASWNTLPGAVAGTGNTISFTDTTFGTNSARCYRVTTRE